MDVGQGLVAPPVDEQGRLMQVALFAGEPGQFDQAELDLRVTPDPLDPTATECGTHVIRGTSRHLDEFVAPRGAGPGHGGLDHVTEAVELVSPLEIAVSGWLARAPEHRVQVAIGLLCRGDDLGQLSEQTIGRGGTGTATLPRRRLHQLVDVGVGEHHAVSIAGKPALGRRDEVAHPSQTVHPLVTVLQSCRRVDLLATRPEAARDLDLVGAQRPKPPRAGNDGATVDATHQTWSFQECSGSYPSNSRARSIESRVSRPRISRRRGTWG